MAEGEFAQVTELLGKALQRPEVAPSYIDPASDHDVYAMLADLATVQRDRTALDRYAALARSAAESCDHSLYQAIALRALGVAAALEGRYEGAEALLEEALASFRTLGARWQVGRTLVELADVAQNRADSASAAALLSRALEAFESLGAGPDIERTRSILNSL